MHIEIRLNKPSRRYQPGEMIEGEVLVRSSERQRIERIEVDLVSRRDDVTSMSGQLAGAGVIDGAESYPLMILVPHNGSDDDGERQIIVSVRGENDWNASVPITVETSPAGKTSEVVGLVFGVILMALPFLAAGIYGMGMAISNASTSRIPLGVVWFFFGGGFCGVLIARGIMGGREKGRVIPWMAAPIALVVAMLGLFGFYIAMMAPGLNPLHPALQDGSIHSLLSIIGAPEMRARVFALLAAGLLLPTAVGVMLRRAVSPWLQVEISLTVITGMIALIVLVAVGAELLASGHAPMMETMPEMWVIALIGVILIPGAFSRPTWTEAPTISIAAGLVPLIAGLLALYASFASDATAQTTERIAAALCILWGVAVCYRGGRNVLVSLATARVEVTIAPEPVTVGGSLTVQVAIDPHRAVTLTSISGVLRCTQIYATRTGTSNRRLEHQTVHLDRRSAQFDEQLTSGASIIRDLRFTIPIGLNPTDESSSTGTYWTLDVKVAFAGSADWAAVYPIRVASS